MFTYYTLYFKFYKSFFILYNYFGDVMKTVKEFSTYLYEIKKSKFITLLYQIDDISKVNFYLDKAKELYKDATHYCFAYKVNGIQKFSDDGEPGGTAGLPIIEVLNKRELDNILCIVIRYFGGIKLGAGGLVRAYSKAVRDALDNSEIISLVKGYLISIIVNYDEQKQLDYLFGNRIIKKDFNEKIIYYIEIKEEDISLLNNINYEILEERMIKESY